VAVLVLQFRLSVVILVKKKKKQATFSKRIHLLFVIIRFPNSKYIVEKCGHGLAKFCGQLYFWFGGMVLITYCSYIVCS